MLREKLIKGMGRHNSELSREGSVKRKGCKVSRARDAKRKGCQGKIGFKRNWCQQKVVSEKVVRRKKGKNVEGKRCLWPMGLWAFIFFYWCPTFWKLLPPGLPGLY